MGRHKKQTTKQEELVQAVFESIDEDYWYRNKVTEGQLTINEAIEECFYDYGIEMDNGGFSIDGYSTKLFKNRNQMVEAIEDEANYLHECNWWNGILDEDTFCDCEAGDDTDYTDRMADISLLEKLSDKACSLLW